MSAPQKVTSVHPIQPHHSSVQPYELFISKTFPSTSQRTEPQPTLLVLEFAAPISVQSISQKSCGRSILCPGIALACLITCQSSATHESTTLYLICMVHYCGREPAIYGHQTSIW